MGFRIFPNGGRQCRGSPTDKSFRSGPGGDFYYVDFRRTVRRVHYSDQNRSPTAVAAANPVYGALPLTVRFNGTKSSDPDNDVLTYAWDFNGDGVFDDAATATAGYTYSQPGTYVATLRSPSLAPRNLVGHHFRPATRHRRRSSIRRLQAWHDGRPGRPNRPGPTRPGPGPRTRFRGTDGAGGAQEHRDRPHPGLRGGPRRRPGRLPGGLQGPDSRRGTSSATPPGAGVPSGKAAARAAPWPRPTR